MSSPTVKVTVDIGDVEKGLDAMERRGRALLPVMIALKKPMKDDQADHRKAKVGPDGSWAPRASSTVARAHGKRKLSRNILGRLPTAVSYKATATEITGESKVKWSNAQQEGGRVGRGSILPARAFLWISDRLLVIAENAISGGLLAAYGGRP